MLNRVIDSARAMKMRYVFLTPSGALLTNTYTRLPSTNAIELEQGAIICADDGEMLGSPTWIWLENCPVTIIDTHEYVNFSVVKRERQQDKC